MLRRWLGPLVMMLICGGIALVLVLNLQFPQRWTSSKTPEQTILQNEVARPAIAPRGRPFREFPIGEDVERNHMRIAAVWLPSVELDGMTIGTGSDVIHLEADIHATQGNPNGFALGEFIPYLKISYRIEPEGGGRPLEGSMLPMVARDGCHYGANLSLPKAGRYRLTYALDPPSAGGLGRHSDPVTGVAPWWKPFKAEFDWDYPGPHGLVSEVPSPPSGVGNGASRR